ncbi:MAG: VOC family protein [Rhodospirillales bacterium]
MKINYVELPAVDLEAMQAFYGKAFGWSFESWGADYMAFADAGLDGGFRRVDEPAPKGGALVVLYAEDLAAAEAAVTAAGGKVVEREEFPGGRRFLFTDPSDNELAVWTKD